MQEQHAEPERYRPILVPESRVEDVERFLRDVEDVDLTDQQLR